MRFALPLVALAALAAPAAAQTVTVRIAYGDVDVTSAEGRATLESRIDSELRRACMRVGVARYSFQRELVDTKCVTEARAAALAEVDRIAANELRSGRAIAAN